MVSCIQPGGCSRVIVLPVVSREALFSASEFHPVGCPWFMNLSPEWSLGPTEVLVGEGESWTYCASHPGLHALFLLNTGLWEANCTSVRSVLEHRAADLIFLQCHSCKEGSQLIWYAPAGLRPKARIQSPISAQRDTCWLRLLCNSLNNWTSLVWWCYHTYKFFPFFLLSSFSVV